MDSTIQWLNNPGPGVFLTFLYFTFCWKFIVVNYFELFIMSLCDAVFYRLSVVISLYNFIMDPSSFKTENKKWCYNKICESLCQVIVFRKLLTLSCLLFFTAPFFVECISEQDLDEMNIEIIRNTLYKVALSNNNKIKLYLLSSVVHNVN